MDQLTYKTIWLQLFHPVPWHTILFLWSVTMLDYRGIKIFFHHVDVSCIGMLHRNQALATNILNRSPHTHETIYVPLIFHLPVDDLVIPRLDLVCGRPLDGHARLLVHTPASHTQHILSNYSNLSSPCLRSGHTEVGPCVLTSPGWACPSPRPHTSVTHTTHTK